MKSDSSTHFPNRKLANQLRDMSKAKGDGRENAWIPCNLGQYDSRDAVEAVMADLKQKGFEVRETEAGATEVKYVEPEEIAAKRVTHTGPRLRLSRKGWQTIGERFTKDKDQKLLEEAYNRVN